MCTELEAESVSGVDHHGAALQPHGSRVGGMVLTHPWGEMGASDP